VWALIGVAGLCCLICVLYVVGMASMPKPGQEEKELEALITELENKHPDIDFNQVRSEIYAQMPDMSRVSNVQSPLYNKLSAVEAQRLVDEALKLHENEDKKAKRMTVFNPPFRGMFRSRPLPPNPPRNQYGLAPMPQPASPRYGLSSLRSDAPAPGQYGQLPNPAAQQADYDHAPGIATPYTALSSAGSNYDAAKFT